MTCETILDNFSDYLTGDLDEAARNGIRDHISGCTACREELENLTLIWARLGVLPEERPGSGLRDRFYAMIEERKAVLAAASGRKAAASLGERPIKNFCKWFAFRRPAFAASFSAFLLLFGIGAGWFLAGGPDGARRLAVLSAEVQDMRQQVALNLMDRPSAADRLLGIGFSTAVDTPDGTTLEALIAAVNGDPNPNVRLAAVEALYLFRNRPGVREGLVRSLTVQAYPIVQIAIIDFLVDVREERAAEALKHLIDNENLIDPAVRNRAEQGLKQL
ncbi:MAG: HEAT repeat domain-containing protein [Acidobacteriota bacterium]|nr:HEAT repeat domain-containing protein [Acidobacteriota bacterium]